MEKGNIIYSYDDEGRLIYKYVFKKCPEDLPGFCSYSYNADGKLEQVIVEEHNTDEKTTVYTYEYDDKGYLIKDSSTLSLRENYYYQFYMDTQTSEKDAREWEYQVKGSEDSM